jgi:quinol monooxygenase YgiN
MITLAFFVRLQAQPGKEAAVEEFLRAGLAMANNESTTPIWFALKLSPSTFAIFDAFHDEAGRQRHINGPIAAALKAKWSELFVGELAIESIDVLGLKNQAA